MSDELIKIKIGTREEAVEQAVQFLRTAESPNVIKSTTQFHKGIAGIIMFSGDPTKEVRKAKGHAYFPIYKEQNSEEILLDDALDFAYFYDRVPDNVLYGYDMNMCASYILDDGICGMVSDTLVSNSKTVERCITKIKQNTDKFYALFFNDVTDKLLRKGNKTEPIVNNEEKTLTPFMFLDKATELPVYDRLGILHFYDTNNVIVVKEDDSFLLVVLAENKYVKIHRTMLKYNTIKAIVGDVAWTMKNA